MRECKEIATFSVEKRSSIVSVVDRKFIKFLSVYEEDSYYRGFEIHTLNGKIILSLKTKDNEEEILLDEFNLTRLRDCLDDYLKNKRV